MGAIDRTFAGLIKQTWQLKPCKRLAIYDVHHTGRPDDPAEKEFNLNILRYFELRLAHQRLKLEHGHEPGFGQRGGHYGAQDVRAQGFNQKSV
jgi:hypothetical protein